MIEINSPQIAGLDGWIPAGEAWAYASASTITVPTGAASRYAKGDRLKLTQSTVKYFVVVAVADTLLTIAVNTDYVVANAAISANFYSHQAAPLGYPDWFTFNSNPAGWAATPTQNVSKYRIVGQSITIIFDISGTSNATTATITSPVANSANVFLTRTGYATDNSAPIENSIVVVNANATVNFYTTSGFLGWTASGLKRTGGLVEFPF